MEGASSRGPIVCMQGDAPRERAGPVEDRKGARRMPWRGKSTKGAASCDKPRGGANGLRSADSRMGEPTRGHALVPRARTHRARGATGGTETSKYPEEEKSTEIPGVAASETGPGPKPSRARTPGGLPRGGCWAARAGVLTPRAVRNRARSGTAWEGRRHRVRAPYAKRARLRRRPRVPPGTRNPAGSRGDHPPRLNTLPRPIANKYREGKVKSTPRGE